MVAAFRSGLSLRTIARRHRVSVATVWRWVQRAQGRRLDRVDWTSRPRGNPRPLRTSHAVEQAVLSARVRLRDVSALGEYGAAAIHAELVTTSGQARPCVRTIHRILQRHGLVRRGRSRWSPPPSGWYLPEVAGAQHELDEFDFVEGLALAGGRHFDVLTAISLWGKLAGSAILHPGATLTGSLQAVAKHWQDCGRPTFAQFDNDSIFQGSHGHPAHLGRFVHGCLCLGVTPVFAPPRETGFQARIEALNRRWQIVVWRRFRFNLYQDLEDETQRFIIAHRQKHAVAADHARRIACHPLDDAREPLVHRVIFLRRADPAARIELLRHSLQLPPAWQHRLVRCEIDLLQQRVACFGLRRREPANQPLLVTHPLCVHLTPWFSKPR